MLQQVTQMVHYFEPMVTAATGSASHLLNSKQQMMMLDQSKTVTECALQLVYAAKEAGGNPKVRILSCLTVHYSLIYPSLILFRISINFPL